MRLRFFLLALLVAVPLRAGEVAKADLDILGLTLEVDRNPVTTAVDIPAFVQTTFGGKSGDEAPVTPGLSALGELTGPGIETPITLATTPGRPFTLPALHDKGEYALQNIRLVGASGEFLQQAIPSFAIINVTDVLKTEIRVRQLTAEELRERGIQVDSRNYDVFEYTLVFGVDQQTVTVPYPVIIDKRTHEVVQVPRESPYTIPPIPATQRPPRFNVPDVAPFQMVPVDNGGGGNDAPDRAGGSRPGIPAALVVPNGFGVLHQFFAVILQVQNSAPDGSNIRLDSISATINAPSQLRVAKVTPAVSIGQPVPVVDEKTGATFLVAGARGNSEWSVEALKAGTHTVDVEVRATFQKPGQADMPMRGRVAASLVVTDPRFQINFSHPDTVRKDEKYTAYAFITNLSSQRQHVVLDTAQIPACSSGAAIENICRFEGDTNIELDLEPGQMKPVPYRMLSKITGKVFAAAGVASDDAIGTSVKLTMGVSSSGIPLSPATLVMPFYAQYLPPEFVDANMQLLGLAYGLATAPLNQYTAKFPRVIKTDIFYRAQQIARAGQRVFITRENREPFFHLALDLLGNTERLDQLNTAPELHEWDALRRSEESGRRAEAAIARQLEANGFTVDAFASATSHRTPFLLAYAHGPVVSGLRPYALSVKALTSGGMLDVPAETASGWTRTLPYSQLTQLNTAADSGELALVGRWREEDFRISVVPAASTFTLHLIYPDTVNGSQLRTDIDITNATPGVPVELDLRRGARTLIVHHATATPLVNAVPQTELRVAGAAQDLHLDAQGHLVSLLFNRPIAVADAKTLRDRFALTVNVVKASYSVTRRNTATQLEIPGAALQEDGKIINVSFDKTLSRNAAYLIGVDAISDLATSSLFSKSDIVPRIDNDRPGGILTGRVLRADNTPVPNVLVVLNSNRSEQLDISGADGRYLFEFVPRDLDSGITGAYSLSASDGAKSASLEGAVRLPGEVHTVNLVFLGRGRARGQVRYSDGEIVPNIEVTIGSTMFDQARHGVTDANGNYDIGDLPVGPLTFSVIDREGRPTYAANQIRTAGEVVTQDLVIVKREPPGTGTVRVIVRRSDTNTTLAGALVGVWQQGYALRDGITSSDGSLTFTNVPAGVVSILASDFSISRNGAGVEVDLRADQTLEQTLLISVPLPNVQYATLEGVVLRDDPAAPGDTTKDQVVAGAIVTIDRMPSVTANADGTYLLPDLPLDFSGRAITVFDPGTGRRGFFAAPTLVAGSNHFTMRLRSTQPAGLATMRVRLYGSHGEPVSGYRVVWPGFPPDEFAAKGNGIYELANMRVPQTISAVAVPVNTTGPYGEQVAFGNVRVDFHGQVGVTDLRLPGSGTIVVRLEIETPCATPPCYTQATGPVFLNYSVWDEAEQSMIGKTIEVAPDPNTGLVTFAKVPARQNVTVGTVRNPAGYATAPAFLSYDGDVRNVTLRLKTIGDVSGRVLAYDGVTPVSGATVRIFANNASYSPVLTNPDGSFRFAGIAAATSFTLIADLDRDGVYRTGIAGGTTPQGGGPVANLVIRMRQQSTVEGKVVDTGNTIVPLARFWLRELEWPYRSIGTPQDPLQADINGRFLVSNVFTGEFRMTAVDPANQEIRGDYQGFLAEEGDASQRNVQIRIGGGGIGSISVTVVDPLLGFARVANAEVAIYRNGQRFDFATTNDNGIAFFDGIPVGGTYSVGVYSKAVGRGGGTGGFGVFHQQTSSVTVQLEFRGFVSGTVTDPESEPAPGLPVKGTPVRLQSQSLDTAASTDVDGAFEFNGVPEGTFTLTAFEIGTFRTAVAKGLFISKLVPEQRNVHLELERTGTLTVKVFLPNDTGGEGELAPLTEVTVWQGNLATGPVTYFRGQQGNPTVFRKLRRIGGYNIEARELGGEGRVVRVDGGFLPAEFSTEYHIVLPTSGSVEVRVVDAAGHPVEDAKVDILAPNIGRRTLFTPATGIVKLPGVPFGWITAQASKGNVAASAGGQLFSRSQPLQLTLNLGTNASVEGLVDAELGIGQPSIGTRVVLVATTHLLPSPLRLETLTDNAGAYRFTGIPVGGTTLALTFYGSNDTSIGAQRTVPVADGTTGVITIPRVKIDATPPRVLSIDPPANATSVSPSTMITVTFSEQIAAQYLNSSWFQLLATDTSSFVNCTIEPSVRPDGTFIVKMIPPAPPAGQKFPLKSNVMYRFSIPEGIQDTTGNRMTVAVGASFTTVNYTEPSVVRVEPPENLPIPADTTFRIKFNKAIDITAFDAGQGGVLTLERLDSYKGTPVATLAIAKFLDAADPSTLIVAPQGVAIAESSFYRITVSGARDTQTPPNVQKDPRVFEFSSFDTRKPLAKIVSPVAAGESLVSELLYTATVSVTDEGTGAESGDVAYVDWLDANGTAIARVKTKPFSYNFAAPATSTGTTFTLKASAVDLSGNVSPAADSLTWNVAPNVAPRELVVTNTPASAYPTHAVQTRVKLKDEGLTVNVSLELRGTKTDGTEYRQVLGATNVTRASTTVDFPDAVFNYTLADTLKDGAATVVITATDSVNKSATAEAPLAILADTTPPLFVSFLPNAETHYRFNQTFTVRLQVKDAETGIARAVFTVDGREELNATSGAFDPATGITTFTKNILVPPKNADTRIAIVVTAYDRRNNATTATHEVIYDRVDDAALPKAAWLTPLDGAALPANQSGWLATLRVRASDDNKVTAVRFESTALAQPIVLENPKNGTTDIFEVKTQLAFPADRSAFVIKAIVSDGDPAHDVELPITIDPVDAEVVISGDINISSITADQYANKSVLVRGARLFISVPITMRDLILVDGAELNNPEETKLDVTITDHFFVDGNSVVNVSGKGYLGGRRGRADNSFTNFSLVGRTMGGTTTGGATRADGSHAGIGGSFFGTTNATYGSITAPTDFGSGGFAPSLGEPGGNGGGAIALRGGAGLARFVLAGGVWANGDVAASAGAGGSILIDARALIASPLTRITANGGDEGGSDAQDLGGGGGRVAIHASERLDLDPANVQARGGRNGFYHSGGEGPSYVDGGAGTIHLQRPGAALGELIVSSFDDRFAATTHRTAGTPLGGTLAFDSITIGPRALARFDATTSSAMTVDPTATVVTPADLPTITLTSTTPAVGGNVVQNTVIATRFDAASVSGIREVRTILSVQPSDVVAYPRWPVTLTDSSSTIAIPSNAPTGAATLRVRVTDRAGRVAETAPVSFNVIANAAPVIQTFDVTPPAEIFANHSISVSAAASDDLEVKSLTLTSSLGSVTSGIATKPTPTTMARTFTVAIPPNAPSNSDIVLTLSALDDVPGRLATTATHIVKVKKDTIAPAITIVKPAPNAEVQEGAGATFVVEANVVDAEVAVSRVTVTFEGSEYDLALVSGNLWRRTLNVPSVDGSEPVAKTLTIKATDYDANTAAADQTFFVKPLLDPDAPQLQWVCASPGAIYPPGYEITLRMSAVPSSPANGVSSVAIAVDGTTLTVTPVGSNVYEAKYTIPGAAADGALFNVRVTARSVSGNESTLLGTLIAVVNAIDISTTSIVNPLDSGYQNRHVVVRAGGTLTLIGEQHLRNLVVLSGGKVIQRTVDENAASLVTVERLSVACGGAIDVSALGYARNTSHPGAGVPDDGSGGSHIGRGGTWSRLTGGVFGSVYEPLQPGGGGNTPDGSAASGGGIVRIAGTNGITIDGTVSANGAGGAFGGGAGGSIWLSTPGTLAGSGTLQANGASATYGGGGGGAIVLEYATATGALATTNAFARGGVTTNEARHAAAGTVLRRSTGALGELVVDNGTTAPLITSSATELPSFGRATVAGASAGAVVLSDRRWLSPSLAGNRVRAFAPDGSTRGTYRIARVTNPAASFAQNFYYEVRTQDSVAYDGHLMFSASGLGAEKRTFAAVRLNGAQWQYDNDSGFVNFTPAAGDYLFASFSKTTDSKTVSAFTRLELLRCCTAVAGLPTIEVVQGEVVTDAGTLIHAFGPLTGATTPDPGEIYLHGDGVRRGFVLSAGVASLTLESLDGTPVTLQAGDLLRGVYAFDSIRLTSARVVSEDLVESTGGVQMDAASSLIPGNATFPAIDASAITIQRGARGPIVVGVAGAASDPDLPLEVIARNGNAPPPPFLRADNYAGTGATGGFSVHHVENARAGGTLSALAAIGTTGYLGFMPSQTNAEIRIGLGTNTFRLRSDGTYEVWANGAFANKSGAYAANTAFRMERRPSSLRWIVDDVIVHEVTIALAASLQLEVAFAQATGEIGAIEYSTTSLPREVFHAKVAADGSFRVPILGNTGDPITIAVRDRHPYSLESRAMAIGAIPNDVGVATVALQSNELTGGRTTIATVTLLAPAGSEGALVELTVELTSSHAAATVPATITIPPGSSSGTFTVTTFAVSATTDVTIGATYGGLGTSALLRVTKDTIAPAVAVASPAANSQYTEGQAVKIAVEATATDADSGVKRVFAVIDGIEYDLAQNAGVYTGQVPVPFVDGTQPVTRDLIVRAEDNADNVGSSAAVPLLIHPVVDAATPTIAWSCGGSAMFPAGHIAKLRVIAKAPNAVNVLHKVELTIAGTVYAASSIGSDTFEAAFPVPAAADGTILPTRFVATTASGTTAITDGSLTVLGGVTEISSSTTIAANDTSKDNKTIVVAEGATLTIAGKHTFTRLVVLANANVVHAAGQRLDLEAGAVYVACSGAMDVTGRGPATSPVPFGDGGTHLGRGGNVGEELVTFGSVERPQESGGAAASRGAGGGIVRIVATSSVSVDGAIRANGADNFNGTSSESGGAAGSVWITTANMRGIGSIEANGGIAHTSGGGGGTIAIEYTDAASVLPSLIARGGTTFSTGQAGGAGTKFVRGPSSTLGDLFVENSSATNFTELPRLGSGIAQSGSTGPTLVTDAASNIASYFAGHWIEVSNASGVKGIWRIGTSQSINAKTVTLVASGAETISVQPGDVWSGVYRFDTVRLRNAKLISFDRVLYAALDKDAASSINAGAPWFPANRRAQIVLNSTITGDTIVAAAGAVTDLDSPVTITATNIRTGANVQVSASADGSFAIPVTGQAGDTFTVRAADTSASFPFTSSAIPVSGAIIDLNGVTSLNLTPSAVGGGATATGTIRLGGAASAGGVTVTLSSSSSFATVPASIVIPEGWSAAQFSIATTSPAVTQSSTITATYRNTKTASLTIVPPSAMLTSLTLDNATVEGGASINGTVTLSGAAPAGGASVMLASSDPARAAVPLTVLIAEGTTSAVFTIATSRVGATTSATITATYGATKTATLALTACAAFTRVAAPSLSAPALSTPTNVWFDAAAPSGAAVNGAATFDDTQSASGAGALHFAAATGVREWSLTGAPALALGPNDSLVFYVLVNPCNPPRQILAAWSDGTTESRRSWGEGLIEITTAHTLGGAIPPDGAWTRVEVTAKALGITTTRNLTRLTLKVHGGEAWFDLMGSTACAFPLAGAPAFDDDELVWFDDALPAGATAQQTWNWTSAQVASGSASMLQPLAAGPHEHGFTNAQPFAMKQGDMLFAYVLIDPCNPPRQLMLAFNNDRRAYWGDDLLFTNVTNSPSNVRMGPMPETGKWVRLEVPASFFGLEGASITAMAMKLYDGQAWFDRAGKYARVNVAYRKTATQPSTEFSLGPANVVDGNTATYNHTVSQSQPWVEIDLGTVQPIEHIQIWNRVDNSCCIQRLRDHDLFVSDVPFSSPDLATTIAQAGVSRFRWIGSPPPVIIYTINRTGRYIRLQLPRSDNLNVAEIQVWAPAAQKRSNLAGGRFARQSSIFDGWTLANNGVDGSYNNSYQSGASIFFTGVSAEPWWDVDLSTVSPISSIDLLNRVDGGNTIFLSDFYVFVSDAAFSTNTIAGSLAQSGVAAFYYGQAQSVNYTIQIQRAGRYVRVQRRTTSGNLGFSEVHVWSQPSTLGALSKPEVQQ